MHAGNAWARLCSGFHIIASNLRRGRTRSVNHPSTKGKETLLSPYSMHDVHSALQRSAAESVLRRLQENPDAWTRVDAILEQSPSQQSKYFALQVRERRRFV